MASKIVDASTGLSVTVPASAGFSIPLLLVDTDDVPLDRAYLQTSKSEYASDLTSGSDAYNWCVDLWGQNYNPASAYIGRWAKVATSPRFVMADCAAFSTTWSAVLAGDFAITDGTSTEEFTTGSMATATSLADVLAIIQTEVRTASTFAADLSAAVVSIDALGRPYLESADTGSTAETYSIIAPTGGSGTDITGANYLNIASGAFIVAGIDAEDPDDALARIKQLANDPKLVCVRGASIAQEVSLAASLATYRCVGFFKNNDPNAKSSVATTDTGYLLTAASNKNVLLIYTEHTTQNPDAAIIGEVCPQPEGSVGFALTPISNCYPSGLGSDGTTIKNMTTGEETVLKTKGYDFLDKPKTQVHLRTGLTPGGVEMRHRIAFYWADQSFEDVAYAYLLGQKIVTFSDADIQAIGGLYKVIAQTLVDRKVIEPDFVIDLPTAAEFSATVKATHILTLADMAELMGQYAVTSIVATMAATV